MSRKRIGNAASFKQMIESPGAVISQVESGVKDLRKITGVLSKISSLDEEYCKKVQRLVSDETIRMHAQSNDAFFSVRNAALALLSGFEDFADIRLLATRALQENVILPLSNFQKEASERLKKQHRHEKDERAKLQAFSSSVDKLNHKCIHMNEAMKNAELKDIDEVQSKKLAEKNSSKFTRFTDRIVGTLSNRPYTSEEASSRLDVATTQYTEALENAAKSQERYFDVTLPDMMARLEDLERERGSVIHAHVQAGAKVLNSLGESVQNLSTKIDKVCLAIDIESDVGSFVTHAVSHTKNSTANVQRRTFVYDLPINRPGSIFRRTIQEAAKMDKNNVPFILIDLISILESTQGFTTEGIFRVSADHSSLLALSMLLERPRQDRKDGELLQHCSSPHIASGMIKQWLRSIPEPVIVPELYEQALCLGDKLATNENTTNKNTAGKFSAFLLKLPKPNRLVVEEISQICLKVSTEEKKTKMTLHNLSVVFAPCLLRAPAGTTSERMLHNSRKEIAFTELILRAAAEKY